MTTASCQRFSPTPAPSAAQSKFSLPILDTPQPNPNAITGPHHLSAVQMLRISVTDVCNLRCVYCMPEEGVEWLPKSHVLTFEEMTTIVRAAASAGITHFKLTGGEPTARRDLPLLVSMLRNIEGVKDLSLTTNGILLLPLLEKLKAAGLNRLTISVDSLKPDRFKEITRGGDFHRVWQAILAALSMGFEKIKLNVVMMQGINHDEAADFAALTYRYPLTVRFIEFMPLARSGLADNRPDHVDHGTGAMISEAHTRASIEKTHGQLHPVRRASESGVGPANVFQLVNAQGRIGFISAMSHPFCETCNRLRLTPDGQLRSCLFDGGEVDLKPILRDTPNLPALEPNGNLAGTQSRLLEAFTTCVTMKPQTHSNHGNKAMNRIGG